MEFRRKLRRNRVKREEATINQEVKTVEKESIAVPLTIGKIDIRMIEGMGEVPLRRIEEGSEAEIGGKSKMNRRQGRFHTS